MKHITEHSAGGVVYRKYRKVQLVQKSTKRQEQILWLISKHSGYHKWTLPKGIVEEAERPEEAAAREVMEETGIKAKIVKKIPTEAAYKYTKNGILVDKRVEFFLMEYVSGDIRDHCWEMEEVKWAAAEEGLKLLAFETEKTVLKTATVLV